VRNVTHCSEQRRIDHRCAGAEQYGAHDPCAEWLTKTERNDGVRRSLNQHPGHDQGLTPDPI
jgi:hypothetical protein